MHTQNIYRRRRWHPTPVLLPGKSHGQRSLVSCSPWSRKELDTTERLHFHFSLSCIGEANGNPLQCSCLENPRDGSRVGCRLWGRRESDTTEATQQQQQIYTVLLQVNSETGNLIQMDRRFKQTLLKKMYQRQISTMEEDISTMEDSQYFSWENAIKTIMRCNYTV